jgi:hypothetical protein
MDATLKPRLLTRAEINESAWNRCVEQSPFSLTYGCSWYLDALCDQQWSGLIGGDYDAVMPLVWRRKYGITYLYQPFFCQQLGLFGESDFLPAFLETIAKHFRFADIQLHTGTAPLMSDFTARTTYWLRLNTDYETLRAGYNKDARKNLRRLEEQYGHCLLEETLDYDSVVALYREAYGKMNPLITAGHYQRLTSALRAAARHGALESYRLKSSDGTTLAAGVFLRSREHFHYILGGPLERGNTNGVHGLIDRFIRQHAGSEMTLDFEGSEIPSVAYFYSKFGAEPVHYYRWRMNRLPRLLRWAKK